MRARGVGGVGSVVSRAQAEFGLGPGDLGGRQHAVLSLPAVKEPGQSLGAQLAGRGVGQPGGQRLARLGGRGPDRVAEFRVEGDAQLVDLHRARIPR
jgi:hypothetical protein